jgi:predicted small lipoprotein YifL
MIRLLLVLAVLAPALLSLAACGKYGPNSPPGPADKEILYRLPYPSQ